MLKKKKKLLILIREFQRNCLNQLGTLTTCWRAALILPLLRLSTADILCEPTKSATNSDLLASFPKVPPYDLTSLIHCGHIFFLFWGGTWMGLVLKLC